MKKKPRYDFASLLMGAVVALAVAFIVILALSHRANAATITPLSVGASVTISAHGILSRVTDSTNGITCYVLSEDASIGALPIGVSCVR